MSKLGSFSGALMLATALAPVAALVNDAQAQTSLTQQAQADRSHRFNIPSQPLASAVNQFSSVTGLQVGYPAELARGLSSQGVSGEMTADAALAQLLAGSGLTYRFTGTTTVALERATTGTLNVAPATVLGTRAPGESMSNVPSSLTRVSRAELEKQKATSDRIEDILSHTVPGFNPSNNGVRQIRGRNAQVFMNGVPLNEQLRASSGSDLNLLPPEHLDGIEVSRGANSAYGFGS
ncbi:MAG: TonB-dependent siderophore receptor, partial [Rhodospirillales bacterium]|nr:TonB-dependent siderophore receptor [Rhodospirillales bacterium]